MTGTTWCLSRLRRLAVTGDRAGDVPLVLRSVRVHRRVSTHVAAAALALGVCVGAPWLSASASASTFAPSVSEPSVEPSPSPQPEPSSSPSATPSPQSCETSAGVYRWEPQPSGGASSQLPSWVSPSDGPICVQVVDSLVRPVETTSPEPVPLNVQGIGGLSQDVEALRELVLYSVGICVCLLALIAFRARRG